MKKIMKKITINLTIEINTLDDVISERIKNLLKVGEKISGEQFIEEFALNHRSVFTISKRENEVSDGDEIEIDLYA